MATNGEECASSGSLFQVNGMALSDNPGGYREMSFDRGIAGGNPDCSQVTGNISTAMCMNKPAYQLTLQAGSSASEMLSRKSSGCSGQPAPISTSTGPM